MSSTNKVYIGTSGWSYPKGEGTWNGYFYPDTKINELEYYSRFFNTVEVNSTFYYPPNTATVYNWVRRVPEDFLFTIKLWQKFTHPKMYRESSGELGAFSNEDVDLFLRGIDPILGKSKLGALLAQFPPSFQNDKSNKDKLSKFIKIFGRYKLAVELRHRSWSDDPSIEVLFQSTDVAWVHIDEPKFEFSVSEKLPFTGDVAYFRFHGRNSEMWWKGDVETRYKYLYSPEEIRDLADTIKSAALKSRFTFAFFNNHWQAFAPQNAVDTLKALQLPFKDFTIRPQPTSD
jgi:uncharacterized protein YecE (DUF72 family)